MKPVDMKNGKKCHNFYSEIIARVAKFGQPEWIDGIEVLITESPDNVLDGLGLLKHKATLIAKGFLKPRTENPDSESFYIILDPTPNRELGEIARLAISKLKKKYEEKICDFTAIFTNRLLEILPLTSKF